MSVNQLEHTPAQVKSAKYTVTAKELEDLITCYKRRSASLEELEYIKAHFHTTKELGQALHVDLNSGPSKYDDQDRKTYYGDNQPPPLVVEGFCNILKNQLGNFIIIVLIIASVVSIAIETAVEWKHEDLRKTAWVDGFGIFIAVLIVVLVGTINDWQKEKQFIKLNTINEEYKKMDVLLDGKMTQNKSFNNGNLLVGYIGIICSGMIVPADSILIEGKGVSVDEAAITGEADVLKKKSYEECIEEKANYDKDGIKLDDHTKNSIPSPILISGSSIVSGKGGKFLVLCVGEHSEAGKIARNIAGTDDKKKKEEARKEEEAKKKEEKKEEKTKGKKDKKKEKEEEKDDEDDKSTPLEKKLDKLSKDIGKLGLIASIIVVCILIIRYIIFRCVFGGWSLEDIGLCFGFLIQGITLIVVAIPEGLPLAVVIALAFSVMRMQKEKNFVKKLMACEVMGGVDNICSDKTGTLTNNAMFLTNIYFNNEIIQLDSMLDQKKPLYEKLKMNSESQQMFRLSIACNCALEAPEATEQGLLKCLKEAESVQHPELKEIESNNKVESNAQNLQVYENFIQVYLKKICDTYITEKCNRLEFNSKAKKMTTILTSDEFTSSPLHIRAFTKGGSDVILKLCNKIYTENGIKDIDAAMNDNITKAINDFADKTLRTLLLAYKDIQSRDEIPTIEEDRKLEDVGGFTVFALVGIKDTIKKNVPEAIGQCRDAGIKVRMVTGDNIRTAMAIAKEIHILEKHELNEGDKIYACEGTEFEANVVNLICSKCKTSILKSSFNEKAKKFNEEQKDKPADQKIKPEDVIPCSCKVGLHEIKFTEERSVVEFKKKYLNTLKVMARSFPAHKYLLVSLLMDCDCVVAVTGDGTNDAPALKKANVGFAMGIAGTEVAKAAASIILQDDNFASIVIAAKWGRSIYENIRKFVQFQLTVNIVALVLNLLASAVLQESPLTPIQLLWINLIMDSFASLALATQPPDDELLKKPPYKKKEYIISRKMMKHILGQSIYQIIALCILLFAGEYFIPEDSTTINITDENNKVHNISYRSPYSGFIRTGRRYDYSGKEYSTEPFLANPIDDPLLYTKSVYNYLGPSRHYTVVFCMFIFAQIFNELNARKINDEWNIFEGFKKNLMYMIIWLGTTLITALIIEFGGKVFSCSNGGLAYHQWLICIAFSAFPLVLRILLKQIPDKRCPQIGQKDSDPLSAEGAVTNIKGSSRIHKSLTNMMQSRTGSTKLKQ